MKSVRNMLFTALLLLLAIQAQAFLGFSKYDQLKANGDSVSIPVADVSDGKAHYFQFGDGDKAIKFFVVKSADGKIRSAFDACDVCFKEKKGYTQEGEQFICNNCGMRFHSSRIGEVKGGCNPSPLKNIVEGDKVRFAVADLTPGQRFFQ